MRTHTQANAAMQVMARPSATVLRCCGRARSSRAPRALAARERAKHAAWEADLADGLRERGVAAAEARFLGRITVACCDEAVTRWLAQHGPHRTLGAELDAAFAELAALAT